MAERILNGLAWVIGAICVAPIVAAQRLAGRAAAATVAGAVVLGFRARLRPGRVSRTLVLGARLGYAVPGGVIAVGLLVPFAHLDNLVDAWARARLGVSTGLLVTGTIWLLVLAYVARFMAVALNAYDAGMATVSPRIDAVARTLGRGPASVLAAVHMANWLTPQRPLISVAPVRHPREAPSRVQD